MTTLTFSGLAHATPGRAEISASTPHPSTSHLWARIFVALEVRRQRRALLALDDRMLADVGLSSADAYREAQRPFLDVPASITRFA